MPTLIQYIVTLSLTLVVMVILSLFYIASPSTFVNAAQLKWPSSPESSEVQVVKPNFQGNQLVAAEGVSLIKRHCLGCHSDQLIIQNRMSRERWEDNITWMQETQGLWNLGRDHIGVIDYLAEHYAPLEVGRRSNLDLSQIEWYQLEDE